MILPNATIGVLGSGQLGRMFALSARQMGYRVHTFSPESDTPTGQVADVETSAAYEDLNAVREFAQSVDVITFEFENVPFATVQTAENFAPVFPKGEILHTTQNRLREKTFLSQNNFPVTPFRHIKTFVELQNAVAEIGFPCVLKTAGFGYDGKGQVKIKSLGDCEAAFNQLNQQDAVLEAFVDFGKEVSVVAARDAKGNFAHFGIIENHHESHILDVSFAPANVSSAMQIQAIEITREIFAKLDVVGVMCVEFFVTKNERLLVNELAPRPHNSGHLTIDACQTSQFEQQLRAVCGLPLGSTEFFKPCAMANLLGNLWQNGEPLWGKALEFSNLKLHLYGKAEPRNGRKMGHLTALSDSQKTATQSVINARSFLITK